MKRLLWLVLLLTVISCTQTPPSDPLPTLASTAEGVAVVDGDTSDLPATRDLTDSNTPVPTPVPPTRRPRPTSTPIDPLIGITDPNREAELVLGTTITVRGVVQGEPEHTVAVALVSATGHVLANAIAPVEENIWITELFVPPNVSGLAQLQAQVLSADNEVLASDVIVVSLVIDTAVSEQYLALFRPGNGDLTVADHNVFFDGFLSRPGGGFLNLSIWTEDCQTKVAQFGFGMRSSSYWQGFVIVPRDLSGSACAVASVGDPSTDNWFETHVLIDILHQDDEDAIGVVIGNPPPNRTIEAGQTFFIYGTAYNAPNDEVLVSVLLDNGRIITESIIEADDWGYWELSILLPFDLEGQAVITAILGEPNDPDAQAEAFITIDPASTPTPGPPPTFTPSPTPTATP